ncbi:UDP-N-acetylglucosamine 2-epimerase [Salinimicrobium sp. TIG7-5_MAKvit]|uniref:UDP-N-acetylglucosamine 2-epimerase n=1 Tax=Salinimicrobium sp. TIG7-5_MAKvit TaxID=3121289 RepID=UPI003C6DBA6D
MSKITIITGTRADFGLLKPLMEAIHHHPDYYLQLVVCGMHLSPEFGSTIEEINKADLPIHKKIESLLSSDTAVGVTKSIGLAINSFAETFEELSPDLLLILGDRSEMLAAATAGMIANIPIAHLHGGETTEGAYDEAIRHAITKMSYWHFTATEIYRKRIVQLGEHPKRVFNVGAIGLDSIKNLKLLGKHEFEKKIKFKLGRKNILVTYHPVTLENDSAQDHFKEILGALSNLEDTHIIFTYANADKNGRIINRMIENFVEENSQQSIAFPSLGQHLYFSAIEFMDVVLGNSSSGIIEVPYFNIPSINIGERQKGRVAPKSVIHTQPETGNILEAIKKAYSKEFLADIQNQEQVYGDGKTVKRIMQVINSMKSKDTKKLFYDISFEI